MQKSLGRNSELKDAKTVALNGGKSGDNAL